MIKKDRYRGLFLKTFILTLILFLTGCVSLHQKNDIPVVDDEVEEIHQLILKKKKAVLENDLNGFLDMCDASDRVFSCEQQRWFKYYQSSTACDYDLKITDIAKRAPHTYVASITQSYRLGSEKTYKNSFFNEKFIHTQNGWKDADLEFQTVVETENFIIKAVMGVHRDLVDEIGKAAEAAHDKIKAAYGEGMDGKTVLKLYDDRNVIRDLTRIGGMESFSGYYMYPGSIKLLIKDNMEWIKDHTLAHEFVHKIVATQFPDTPVPSWFFEGLAEYFGVYCIQEKTDIEKGWIHRKDIAKSLNWIKEQKLSQFKDYRDVNRFYSMAGMIVKHIEEAYGKGTNKAILEASKRIARDSKCHQRAGSSQDCLDQAMEEVLQADMDAIDKKWMAWMENY